MAKARARAPWYARLRRPVLGALAVNALAFAVYTLPHVLMLRNLSSHAAALREEVARERAAAAVARAASEAVRRNREDTKRFLSEFAVARRESLLPTIQFVDKTASEDGLTPKSASYSHGEVKDLQLVRFRIAMPMSGTYNGVVKFLADLERSPRFLAVDKVGLRTGQAGATTEFDFTVSVYFRREPGDVDAD